MKIKIILTFFIITILSGCIGVSSKGLFGTGVSVAFDPRSVGTQIDDSIMQKNLSARILLLDKSYFFSVKAKVLDGRIFLTGKIDELAEKLSSVEALSGLNNEDINKLLEIGINITNKSSEFETQQDAIVESSWREILQNLKNGYSFEALIPNLENESNHQQFSGPLNNAFECFRHRQRAIYHTIQHIRSCPRQFHNALILVLLGKAFKH